MCVLVHVFRVLNVNDVYKLVLRDSVFVANVGWQLDFVNTPLFWQHYTHARTRTHSTTPLCCLLIDGDTNNKFTTTAILSPPIMSTLKHTHQASAFVCHNPHCMCLREHIMCLSCAFYVPYGCIPCAFCVHLMCLSCAFHVHFMCLSCA